MVNSTHSPIGPQPSTSPIQPPQQNHIAEADAQVTHAGRKVSRPTLMADTWGATGRKMGSGIDHAFAGAKEVGHRVSENIGQAKETLKEKLPFEARLTAGRRLKKLGISSKGLLTQGELNAFPQEAEEYLSAIAVEAKSSRALTKLKAKNASVFIAQVLGTSGATAAIGAALGAIIMAIQAKPGSVEDTTGEGATLPEMDSNTAVFSELSDPKLQASLEDLFTALPEATRTEAIATFKEAYNHTSPESRGVFLDAFVQECALEYLRAWEDPSLPVASYDPKAQLIGAQLDPSLLQVIQQRAVAAAQQSAYDAPSAQPNSLPDVGAANYAALGAALGAVAGAGAGGLWAQAHWKKRTLAENEVAHLARLEQKLKTEALSPEEWKTRQDLKDKHEREKINPNTRKLLETAEKRSALTREHQAHVDSRQAIQSNFLRAKNPEEPQSLQDRQSIRREYLERVDKGTLQTLLGTHTADTIDEAIAFAIAERALEKLPNAALKSAGRQLARENPTGVDSCLGLLLDERSADVVAQIQTSLDESAYAELVFAGIQDSGKVKFLLDIATTDEEKFQKIAAFSKQAPGQLGNLLERAQGSQGVPIEAHIGALGLSLRTPAETPSAASTTNRRGSGGSPQGGAVDPQAKAPANTPAFPE